MRVARPGLAESATTGRAHAQGVTSSQRVGVLRLEHGLPSIPHPQVGGRLRLLSAEQSERWNLDAVARDLELHVGQESIVLDRAETAPPTTGALGVGSNLVPLDVHRVLAFEHFHRVIADILRKGQTGDAVLGRARAQTAPVAVEEDEIALGVGVRSTDHRLCIAPAVAGHRVLRERLRQAGHDHVGDSADDRAASRHRGRAPSPTLPLGAVIVRDLPRIGRFLARK